MILTRQLLSSSTNGKSISVTATATAGTAIHSAVAGASSFDALYLWAVNVTTSVQTITLEWGGVSDPADHLVKAMAIQPNSPPVKLADGLVLNGAVIVRAFASTAASVNVFGYVNRIQ